MAATVQLGQYFHAGVQWTDPQGNPMEPVQGELPTWTVDKQNIIEFTTSAGTPGTIECRATKLGDCTLTVTASFDIGVGVHIASATKLITVVQFVTPEGEIVLSLGDIRPIL